MDYFDNPINPRIEKLRSVFYSPKPVKSKTRKTILDNEGREFYRLRKEAKRILRSPNHEELEELIVEFISPPNEKVHAEAKKLYEFLMEHYPNALCLKLSHTLLQSPSFDVKSECSSVLHNYISFHWTLMFPVIKSEVKIVFLEILRQGYSKEICKEMWKTVTELFKYDVTKKCGDWNDMISCFLECLHSGPPYVQDCALKYCFLELPMGLRLHLEPYVENLCLIFVEKLKSFNGKRKLKILAASVHLVKHMSSDYYSLLAGLLMPMIRGVLRFLSNDSEDGYAEKSLEYLIELAVAEPRFFESHLNEVFDSVVSIVESDQFVEDTRYLAAEFLSYLIDSDHLIKRLHKPILGRLVAELVRMITRIVDDPLVDVDIVKGLCFGTSKNYLLGVNSIYRISMARGYEMCMPLLFEELPTHMDAPEWQKRFTAVTITGVIAKGCAKSMTEHLVEVMNMVFKAMIDPSPLVRRTAFETVASLSIDLSPHLQVQHGQMLIASLYLALGDDQDPIKQVAAASAMSCFCESCSPCVLEPNLNTIVSKLITLILQGPNHLLHAEALQTLASVARSSKDLFHKCYDSVISCLKKLLAYVMVWPSAVSKLLQDCAVECIWTVAMAVGKNTFKNDAAEVVALLRSVRWFLVEEDHSLKVTLLRAWEQLLSCLGSHFYPHVEDLMPDFLKSASLIGCDRECVILTEKFMACKVLFCLTKEFKEKLFPWIHQVADILVPLVNFDDGDIRKIVVSAMPELLLSAKLSIKDKEATWRLPNRYPSHAEPIALGLTNSYLIKLVRQVIPSLLEALNKETDGEICAEILNSLSRCIKIAAGFQSEKQIERIANAIKQVPEVTSRNHFSEVENVTELEKEIIKQAVNFYRTLIKKYKESSWRFLEEFLECTKAMLENEATAKEKQIALLCFNEVFLKCEGAALRYSSNHRALILEACKTENEDVQKEAARGLGLIAEFGGTHFAGSKRQ